MKEGEPARILDNKKLQNLNANVSVGLLVVKQREKMHRSI
jgi:hypothetical protein